MAVDATVRRVQLRSSPSATADARESIDRYPRHRWAYFDSACLPCVERRKGLMLLATRLMDEYLPRWFWSSADHAAPLARASRYSLTTAEANMLTKLCRDYLHVDEHFSESDSAYDVNEFCRLFASADGAQAQAHCRADKAPDRRSWMTVGDSMIPCVTRRQEVLLPLNVLRGASQVLVDVDIEAAVATPTEVRQLNELCRTSGLTFTFGDDTELVTLSQLRMLDPAVRIQELSSNDPLLMLKTSLMQAGQIEEVTAPTRCTSASDISGPISSQDGAMPNPNFVPKSAPATELSGPSSPDGTRQPNQTAPLDSSPPPLIPLCDDKHVLDNYESPVAFVGEDHERIITSAMESAGPRRNEVATSGNPSRDGRATIKFAKARSADKVGDVQLIQLECFQRTLTCVVRGKLKVKYALVESVMRLYFPQCGLEQFIQYLTGELSVTLHTLKKREERAFIEHYGIPTDRLRSNLIIKLKDFVPRVAWIQNRFGGMDVPQSVKPPVIPRSSSDSPIRNTTSCELTTDKEDGRVAPKEDQLDSQNTTGGLPRKRPPNLRRTGKKRKKPSGEATAFGPFYPGQMPYVGMPPQNWVAQPYPWSPILNVRHPASAGMALSNCVTQDVGRTQQLNYSLQPTPNDKARMSSANAIAEIHGKIKKQFENNFPSQDYAYRYNTMDDMFNNSGVN